MRVTEQLILLRTRKSSVVGWQSESIGETAGGDEGVGDERVGTGESGVGDRRGWGWEGNWEGEKSGERREGFIRTGALTCVSAAKRRHSYLLDYELSIHSLTSLPPFTELGTYAVEAV